MAREFALGRVERLLDVGLQASIDSEGCGMLPVLRKAESRLKDPNDLLTGLWTRGIKFYQTALKFGTDGLAKQIVDEGRFHPIRADRGQTHADLFTLNQTIVPDDRNTDTLIAVLIASHFWISQQSNTPHTTSLSSLASTNNIL